MVDIENQIKDYLQNETVKYHNKYIDYLEVDKNKTASKYEDLSHMFQEIYDLVIDGYHFRELIDKVNDDEIEIKYSKSYKEYRLK